MVRDVTVIVDMAAVGQLGRDPQLRDALMDIAQPVVQAAKAGAPKRTGRGAASIHAEPVLDQLEWTAHISWTRDAFYMGFVDRGTSVLPARPFLEHALEGLAQ